MDTRGTEPVGSSLKNYGVRASLDYAPPMERKREISEQDCSKPLDLERGNLRCK